MSGTVRPGVAVTAQNCNANTSGNASTMKDHKGQWGIWVHEKPYRLHVFRAGSEPGT